MRSDSVSRYRLRLRRGAWTSPALFGLAAWLAFPSVPAGGDLASLLTGPGRAEAWRMVLTDSPAGSIHAAALVLPGLNAALSGTAGMTLADGSRIALSDASGPAHARPDEERVNRAAKKGRVVAIEPMQPPRAFTAGSVLERSSSLMQVPGTWQSGGELASLLRPGKVAGEELALAAFHFSTREPEKRVVQDLLPAVASLVNNPRRDILAAAYAPEATGRATPFDLILGARIEGQIEGQPDSGRFIPPVGPGDHAWAGTPLPATVFAPAEQKCLAEGIYFEARGESVRGQAAVAQVILNRVRNPAFPKTICGVVYQNKDWRNRCQFSFACGRAKPRVRSEHHWRVASDVAAAVTDGRIWLEEVGSATHYHATYVKPGWASGMKKLGQIGLHIFYRTQRGGWS